MHIRRVRYKVILQLEEASTHKSTTTYGSTVSVTRDIGH